MTNITVKNIPDEIIEKIKILSEIEKRSINNEILVILEKGLSKKIYTIKKIQLSKDTQIKIWENLCGKWEDKRSTKEIIDDIYSNRSLGREINL